MRLKDTLNKPYTEEERINFILEYQYGYTLKETEEALECWEYTEEEIAEQETAHINSLTMTALDLITLIRNAGVSVQEIKDYFDSHVELDFQLKYCQNVYCGVVRQLLPLTIGNVEFTDAMIVQAFKTKNGEV